MVVSVKCITPSLPILKPHVTYMVPGCGAEGEARQPKLEPGGQPGHGCSFQVKVVVTRTNVGHSRD